MKSANLIAILAATLISACGGGGGGTQSSTTSATLVSGKAMDGYLEKATVFLDLNDNGNYDAGEPFAETGSDGSYQFSVSPAELANTHAIVALIKAGITIDKDNPNVAVSSSYSMTAPAGKSSTVTPITTLIAAKVSSGLSTSAAEAAVATDLGITSSDAMDLYKDYINEKATNPSYQKLHNLAAATAEVLKSVEQGSPRNMSLRLWSVASTFNSTVASNVSAIKNATSTSSAVSVLSEGGSSSSGGGSATSSTEVSCKTNIGGILQANKTYAIEDSPFCISDKLQIPDGVTVTFNSGTSLSGGSIVVQGTLNLAGVATSKVSVKNVKIIPAGLISSGHSISINWATIEGGSIYAPTGNAIYGSLNLIDSTIANLQSYIYLWYSIGTSQISRNKFTNSGGISFGINYRDPKVVSLAITNNYFSGWTTDYAIQNWAEYGQGSTTIDKNSFVTTSKVALMLPAGYDSSKINAANNYWSTTDTSVIDSMIFDKNDDITSASVVTYLPVLTSPSQNTPSP